MGKNITINSVDKKHINRIRSLFHKDSGFWFNKFIGKIRKSLFLFTMFAIIVFLGSANGQTTVCPPTDMVSWWDGDALSAITAIDIRSGNNGTLQNGATTVIGKVGNAFSFDGTNDYVNIPEQPNLKITGPMTIDAWIKTPGTGNKFAGIAGKIPKLYFNGANRPGYLISVNQYGKFRCDFIEDVNISQGTAISTTTVTDNVFHHVAATYDGNHVRVYVDGILEAEEPYSDGIGDNDEPVRIGFEPSTWLGARYFRGIIDEVGIYDRALSDAEIQAIYDAGSAGKCKTCPGNPKITCYLDSDEDNFGDPNSPQDFCETCAEGYVLDNTDCNDSDAQIHPGQIDICDNIDNDCDGQIDEDVDPDPASSLADLIALIENLVQDGELANNKANPLINKLGQVITKLNAGQTQAAINQMNAFMNQLSAFIGNGTIDAETGEVLQGLGDCLLYSLENGTFAIMQEGSGTNTVYTPHPNATHIHGNSGQTDFQLYPNPTSGAMTIDLRNYQERQISISIYNSFGQQVLYLPEQELRSPALDINLTERPLPNGVYFLSVSAADKREVRQFVLAR